MKDKYNTIMDATNSRMNNNNTDLYIRNVYYLLGTITLTLVTAFVYNPVTYLSFSGPDDHWMLLKNPYINPAHYDWTYFKAIFNRVNDIQYSPLNTLYYSFVYKINGLDPYWFHLMNVIIHFFSSVSIFFLTKNILIAFKMEDELLVSFLTALVWCIHPLNVEAVAWISGSKILICTLCTIISFNLFISGYINKNIFKIIISFLLFIVSFFFKEQAMITPIMYLLFIVFYKLNKYGKISFKIWESVFLLVSFVLTFLFALITIRVNYGPELEFPPINYYPLTQKFLLVCYCAFFYISNFLFPRSLHYNYTFPFDPYDITPFKFKVFPLVVLVIIIIIFFLFKKSKNKYFNLFCILICLSQISLELQVLPMTRPAIVADRYMYFPLIPLLIATLAYISKYRKSKIFKQIISPLFLIYIIYLVLYCNQMASYWHTLNLIK